jgi:hypothetical protein
MWSLDAAWAESKAGAVSSSAARYKRGPMTAVVLWRWVLLRLTRSPAAWAAALGLLAAWLTSRALAPLMEGEADSLRLWAHPAGLVGAALAVSVLTEGAAFLARVDARTRALGELGGPALAALYMQLPILGTALVSGRGPADVGPSALAILSADLHLASLAFLTLLLPCSIALRASALLALTAFLPALCALDARTAALVGLLDPSSALRAETPVSSLAAGLGLALVGYLLRTGPVRG